MNRGAVFILSSWRAGSTLLQRILNAHSRLIGLHELHLPFLELPPGKRGWWRSERRRVVSLARKALEAYGVEASTRDLLHADPRVNRSCFERIASQILTRYRKDILVDKTPNYSLNAPNLERVFPEGPARIFLLRSPGGVADSCARTFPGQFPDLAAGLEHWLRYYSALERHFAAADPRSYLRVRYESLLSGDGEVREVCRFLDVPFEPGMLEYGEAGPLSGLTGVENWGDPSEKLRSGRIDGGNGERWRERGLAEVKSWIRGRPEAAALARSLGYEA